jgi:tetratricopeptide (TPR) repeat protein
MKIKVVFLLSFCMLFIHANGQKKDKSEASSADRDLNIYKSAMQFGDYEAAKYAVYGMLERNPENYFWLDTLTRLYFYNGANNQTVLAGNAFLKKDSTNKDIMEMVAIANANLKRNQESLDLYKRLQAMTHSTYFGYQAAFNEYQLKKFEAGAKTLEGIINDTSINSQSININMGQNNSQRVPLKAAALNLLGVVQLEMNQTEKAKSNFDAALKIQPDFQLAAENFEIANKPKEPAVKK